MNIDTIKNVLAIAAVVGLAAAVGCRRADPEQTQQPEQARTTPASVASPDTPVRAHSPSGGASLAPAVRGDTPVHTPNPEPVVYKGKGVRDGYVSPPPGATPDTALGTHEAPRLYRSVDTVLEEAEPVTLDPAELLLVAGEEPNTFEEAEPHAA